MWLIYEYYTSIAQYIKHIIVATAHYYTTLFNINRRDSVDGSDIRLGPKDPLVSRRSSRAQRAYFYMVFARVRGGVVSGRLKNHP